jgi:acetyltransferase-like isoleucine patch superfamily enzyme
MPVKVASAVQFLSRAAKGTSSRARNLYYKARGVEINGYAWLRSVHIPQNFSDIALANGVALDVGVVLLAVGARAATKKIIIGENTYLNRHSLVAAFKEVRIGRNVGIGPRCYITDHEQSARPDQAIREQHIFAEPTTICDGVWLGAGVMVLKGVTIGVNTVVSAGSLVVRDLPPDVIAGGRPAGVIRKR